MDLLVQAFLALSALLFLYKLCIARIRPEKSKTMKPPEPPGSWPLIGHLHLLGGQPISKTVAAMADKYGPIFTLRFGTRRTIIVSSWEGVKECFTTNDKALASHPRSAIAKYMCYDYAMVGIAPYGPYWRDLRKITMVHLLSNGRLDKLKHIRAMEIDANVKELYRHWTKSSDGRRPVKVGMKKWFRDLTFSMIVTMVAGKRFCRDGGDGELVRLLKLIERFFYYAMVFVPSDVLPLPEWIDWQGHKKGMKKVAAEMDSIMSVYLEEHRRKRLSDQVQGDQDFMDVLLEIMDEEKFSDYDSDTIIKATSLSLILGGTDTSAISMSVALSFVLNNPDVLKKAQDELDMHVGKDRHVDESDIKNLVYLQAVVKESLRLSPVAMFIPLHQAIEDCRIGGFHVPAGTCVMVNSGQVHRDPRMWSDPLVFRPERFLTSHVDVDVRGQHFGLVPFGSGRRACSGISFALQVMHLTLARVLHGFELSRPSNEMMEIENLSIGNPNAAEVDVLLVPRLRHELYD